MWVFPLQTDKNPEHNRLDTTVIDKKSKKYLPIDLACPFDTCIKRKEEQKCTNYSKLKCEVARIWEMKKVEVVTVAIGTIGTITKYFEKWLKKLDLGLTIEALEKPCLLGTARIIRKERIPHFYHEITSDLRVREIKLITIITITIIMITIIMITIIMKFSTDGFVSCHNLFYFIKNFRMFSCLVLPGVQHL